MSKNGVSHKSERLLYTQGRDCTVVLRIWLWNWRRVSASAYNHALVVHVSVQKDLWDKCTLTITCVTGNEIWTKKWLMFTSFLLLPPLKDYYQFNNFHPHSRQIFSYVLIVFVKAQRNIPPNLVWSAFCGVHKGLGSRSICLDWR